MAYLSMSMFSSALRMDTNLCVFLPEDRTGRREVADPDRKYKVLYLLHGMREDQTCWVRKSIVELVARERDCIVVMPTTGVGLYVDQKFGQAWCEYLTEELPIRVCNYFPASGAREDTFIAGNSMGGYGALHAALSHPERYAGAASLSGALQPYEEDLTPEERAANPFRDEYMQRFTYNAFGTREEYLASDNNLVHLAEKVFAEGASIPRLFLCCGTEDPLTYHHVQAFREKVDPLGLEYTYSENKGGHDFGYWNQMIEPVFDFFGITKDENYKRPWA